MSSAKTHGPDMKPLLLPVVARIVEADELVTA